MSKIFLIGYMGVGKTTVGRVLADSINYGFIDMDDNKYWTKLGYSVGSAARIEMYESNREKFWDIETDILKDLCMNNHENLVIATGGSTVLREENVDSMKSSGTIIFLNSNAKTIHDRLKNSDNSLHMTKNYNEENVKEYRKGREPKYKVGDLEIDTSDKSVEEVSSTIIKLLKL